ncbi:fibroin heavy chain isoform X2 [Perca fluviatilis]|uniref:fibroin heavy chain isoform X2 n=1 Tax=Perca fluviatilis TaxID=8168 RepID=UPI0019622D08|nr:fibroin heavy chain isoform X2 [Perca fluviatilis]
MLVQALLQTTLVLWLAQQTLQGGVRPQSVSWGRVLPARVAGALGALGSRYGTKAMKTGIGRYPGAQLGVGGYRALGLGGRAGLKQGGYGGQGAYGAALGTGMLGTGLTNGLGLGQGGKHGYGAGFGTPPGYGALAGIGYPGARPGIGLGYSTGQKSKEQKPGVSAADLGGPQMANLGQAVQDQKREKSKALGPSYGDRSLGPEMPNIRRSNILTAPELQAETGFRPAVLPHGRNVKSLDPVFKSLSPGHMTPLDKKSKGLGLAVSQAQRGEGYEPIVLERIGAASHGATLATGGVKQQLPLDKDNIRSLGSASSQVQSARDYDLSIQQNQRAPNCGSARDLSDVLGINHHELLGSETRRTQGLVPQDHVGKDRKHLVRATSQAQGERTNQQPLLQTHDGRSNIFYSPQGQEARRYVSVVADRQGVKDLGLVAKDKNGPGLHGTIAVENHPAQGGGSYGPVIPGASGTQSLGIASVEGQEAQGFTADGQKAKHLSHAERKSKALSIPGQTGRNTQATRYMGGAGNYLGASPGAGAYGAGLGQGGYLGGAAGKLGAAAALGQDGYPLGVAGKLPGYGEGATGHLGAMAGNGFGYGNGYSDGHGAGLGYPSELADGAENKAGKHQALSTGGYAGQVQGAYGAHGAGLHSTGGKYGGGAAQVPYGNAPVIPTGLEGDGGYPYPAQQLNLGAEGTKTANKYGAGTGYGVQQTGYGAQLGATQDALGEQAGQYGGVNGALGNGYKG